jgi:hypothetical protein
MAGGNGERVARMVNGGAQAANTCVTKVVRVDHGRVVHLVIGDAFDVTGPAELRVDRYGVATGCAARIGESEGLVVVRSCKTASWTCFAGAGARAAIPANTISLSRITRCELVGGNGLIRTAGAGRDREWDRLRSTRVSEIE